VVPGARALQDRRAAGVPVPQRTAALQRPAPDPPLTGLAPPHPLALAPPQDDLVISDNECKWALDLLQVYDRYPKAGAVGNKGWTYKVATQVGGRPSAATAPAPAQQLAAATLWRLRPSRAAMHLGGIEVDWRERHRPGLTPPNPSLAAADVYRCAGWLPGQASPRLQACPCRASNPFSSSAPYPLRPPPPPPPPPTHTHNTTCTTHTPHPPAGLGRRRSLPGPCAQPQGPVHLGGGLRALLHAQDGLCGRGGHRRGAFGAGGVRHLQRHRHLPEDVGQRLPGALPARLAHCLPPCQPQVAAWASGQPPTQPQRARRVIWWCRMAHRCKSLGSPPDRHQQRLPGKALRRWRLQPRWCCAAHCWPPGAALLHTLRWPVVACSGL
jgi:hypothetical protein